MLGFVDRPVKLCEHANEQIPRKGKLEEYSLQYTFYETANFRFSLLKYIRDCKRIAEEAVRLDCKCAIGLGLISLRATPQ